MRNQLITFGDHTLYDMRFVSAVVCPASWSKFLGLCLDNNITHVMWEVEFQLSFVMFFFENWVLGVAYGIFNSDSNETFQVKFWGIASFMISHHCPHIILIAMSILRVAPFSDPPMWWCPWDCLKKFETDHLVGFQLVLEYDFHGLQGWVFAGIQSGINQQALWWLAAQVVATTVRISEASKWDA